MNGWPWSAMKRLSEATTKTVSERAMLLAASAWTDREGCLNPAIETWAELAGCDVRTAQRSLNAMIERGLIERVARSRGGSAKTSTYRICLLAEDPGVLPEWTDGGPGHGVPRTPASRAKNPGTESREPRHGAGRTIRNIQREQPQTRAVVGDIFDRLGIQSLRAHPNATPERLALIERDAPSKANPAGWAAQCIPEGWSPPAPSPEQVTAAQRLARESLLMKFDAMPDHERADLVTRVRRKFTNLSDRTDDDPVFRAAIAQIMSAPSNSAAPADYRRKP